MCWEGVMSETREQQLEKALRGLACCNIGPDLDEVFDCTEDSSVCPYTGVMVPSCQDRLHADVRRLLNLDTPVAGESDGGEID
jgi:hypothetical protein